MIKSIITILFIVSISKMYSNDKFLDSFKEFVISTPIVKLPCNIISLKNGKILPSFYMEKLLNLHNPIFHDSFKIKNSLVSRYISVCKFVYGDFWYVLVHSDNIHSSIKYRRYILIQCDNKFNYKDYFDLHQGIEGRFNFKVNIVKSNIVIKISDKSFKFNKTGECVYGLSPSSP